jgi:hypothetical protein
MDGRERSSHDVDSVAGRLEVLTFGLLRQQPASDPYQSQAQLRQHRHRCEGARDSDVERFSQARIMPGILGSPGNDLDPFEAELGARVYQECGLGLVRFDQSQLELRPDDLERDAW